MKYTNNNQINQSLKDNIQLNNLSDYALLYAKHGLPIFPVYNVTDGICSCGNQNCTSPGKHPMTINGFKDATTDIDTISAWYGKKNMPNIGITTGIESGLYVLDIDKDSGGYESLANFETEHGQLPNTLKAISGGGGCHYYFNSPHPLKSSQGVLPGIDFKGESGYIIAPSSTHSSGNVYEWNNNAPIIQIPKTLINQIQKPTTKDLSVPSADSDHVFHQGSRNTALCSIAGTMRFKGLSVDEILPSLSLVNKTRCDPPLSTQEVELIAKSIGKYKPGSSSIKDYLFGNEAGDARLFVRIFSDRFVFSFEDNCWFKFNGQYWERDKTDQVFAHLSFIAKIYTNEGHKLKTS